MNEKIKSLLTEQLKTWGGSSGDDFSEELEKFAMNIINECVSCVTCCMETTDYESDHDRCMIEFHAQKKSRDVIKGEFGIK